MIESKTLCEVGVSALAPFPVATVVGLSAAHSEPAVSVQIFTLDVTESTSSYDFTVCLTIKLNSHH